MKPAIGGGGDVGLDGGQLVGSGGTRGGHVVAEYRDDAGRLRSATGKTKRAAAAKRRRILAGFAVDQQLATYLDWWIGEHLAGRLRDVGREIELADPLELGARGRSLAGLGRRGPRAWPTLPPRGRPNAEQRRTDPEVCRAVPYRGLEVAAHPGREHRRARVRGEDDRLAVVREGVASGVRHAKSSHVDVLVEVREDSLLLRSRDDGVGVPESGRRSGLANMDERAARHGGEFEVHAGETGGTVLEWRVPVVYST